jgi:hypothetical protein
MKTKYNPKTARFYSLNNCGTRGVSIDANGNRETIPVTLDGVTVKARAVLYHEQMGNFSYPVIRIKGKKTVVFPDDNFQPTKWMPHKVKYPKNS